jgi:hypothetical protein
VEVIAVDWSGKQTRAEESIWLAAVHNGQLASLENGRSREDLVDHLIELAEDEPHTVIGLDFAFSFPRWWCQERGWSDVRDVWVAMANDGERLLQACEAPFWGRPGKPNPSARDRGYRRTELADAEGAKSIFQIGGAGAVGTGSVRGMACLLRLAQRGFDVWPFGPTGWPRVVEIYPRLLTGLVNKSSWSDRHSYLQRQFSSQPATFLERAAGSEDAFDAAVSALVMASHADYLETLMATRAPDFAIEGKIWRPG